MYIFSAYTANFGALEVGLLYSVDGAFKILCMLDPPRVPPLQPLAPPSPPLSQEKNKKDAQRSV